MSAGTRYMADDVVLGSQAQFSHSCWDLSNFTSQHRQKSEIHLVWQSGKHQG